MIKAYGKYKRQKKYRAKKVAIVWRTGRLIYVIAEMHSFISMNEFLFYYFASVFFLSFAYVIAVDLPNIFSAHFVVLFSILPKPVFGRDRFIIFTAKSFRFYDFFIFVLSLPFVSIRNSCLSISYKDSIQSAHLLLMQTNNTANIRN